MLTKPKSNKQPLSPLRSVRGSVGRGCGNAIAGGTPALPAKDRLVSALNFRIEDELRGWNPQNGRPTQAKLEALGMKNVADKLGQERGTVARVPGFEQYQLIGIQQKPEP